MDLKIRTKSNVIGFMILKYVLKSCVIGLMIHKFSIKSSVIQSYEFTNIFDFIMNLNGFFWIFLLKIQRLKSEETPLDLHILLGFIILYGFLNQSKYILHVPILFGSKI